MRKSAPQEPIPACLGTTENGEKAWICGVSGCNKVLAGVVEKTKTIIKSRDQSGTETERQVVGPTTVVSKPFEEISPGIWADPNSPSLSRELKRQYTDSKREEKKRLKELRATRRAQEGNVEGTFLGGIKGSRSERWISSEALRERPLRIICPLHGTQNIVKLLE